MNVADLKAVRDYGTAELARTTTANGAHAGVSERAKNSLPTPATDVETWEQFRDRSDEKIKYLINGIWPAGAFGYTASPPKKGKTWVCLSKALAVSTGTPFLGEYDVPEAAPVLYVALEGNRTALMHRVSALARGIGIDPNGPIENLYFWYKPAGIDLMDPRWVETVAAKAGKVDAALVIVDVLRAAARIKENDAHELGELQRNLAPVVLEGHSVNLAHHFTKLSETSKERDPIERMSGSGAIGGQADIAILITGSGQGARKLRIEYAVRDGAEPPPHGAYLEGHGTGDYGAFTNADTAFWRPSELPSPDDVHAPATDIARWIKEQRRDVPTKAILTHFEISDDTLRRRHPYLAEQGISWRKISGSNYYRGNPDDGQTEL